MAESHFSNACKDRKEADPFRQRIQHVAAGWAGGIEPPNGGIKVRPYPLVFQAELSFAYWRHWRNFVVQNGGPPVCIVSPKIGKLITLMTPE
jgi:hypothetical protein